MEREHQIDWLRSQPFTVIGLDPRSKKRINYLSCIEGKRGGKDILRRAKNAALFVDLL